jgi:hypothetical protein
VGDETSANEMDGIGGTYGGDQKCILFFVWMSKRKEKNTWTFWV